VNEVLSENWRFNAAVQWQNIHILFTYLFIYYKIVHIVQDRQNGQSNIKRVV